MAGGEFPSFYSFGLEGRSNRIQTVWINLKKIKSFWIEELGNRILDNERRKKVKQGNPRKKEIQKWKVLNSEYKLHLNLN